MSRFFAILLVLVAASGCGGAELDPADVHGVELQHQPPGGRLDGGGLQGYPTESPAQELYRLLVLDRIGSSPDPLPGFVGSSPDPLPGDQATICNEAGICVRVSSAK